MTQSALSSKLAAFLTNALWLDRAPKFDLCSSHKSVGMVVGGGCHMTKKRARAIREEPEELTARILKFSQNYFISRSARGDHAYIDDEAALEITGVITSIASRHKKHLNEPISFSLLHAVRYTGEVHELTPFFGSVTVRGQQRSALAYLPAEPFWRLPLLIERGANVVQVQFSPLRRGFGDMLSLFVGSETDLQLILPTN